MLRKTLFFSLIIFASISMNGFAKNYQLKSKSGWYKDATFYHVWVKSFKDSDDKNKIGDIKGVISKLDYLDNLGITAIWLSPIFDCGEKFDDPKANMHGYDTTNYYGINNLFGNMKDVEKLLKEAHKRGIRVIFDFVPNHTSTKHPWFLSSTRGGRFKDWYVWHKEPEDLETDEYEWTYAWGGGGSSTDVWRSHNDSYFYSAFNVDSLADLNFNNPAVQKEMLRVVKFWFDKGFDGIRIDAARFLYEDGPGRQADSKRTHAFYKKLRKLLNSYDRKGYGKVMVAEAWTDENNIPAYYGKNNDEFHLAFDFPFGWAVVNALNRNENDVLDLYDLMLYYQEENILPATFLSNHDNHTSRPLTAYKGNQNKCITAAAMNFFSPGVPFVYYGNEVSLHGQMGADISLRKYIDWNEVNKQSKNPNSVLNWYKYMLKARNKYVSLRRGKISQVESSEDKVLAFLRSYKKENMLVVVNFSNSEQDIELDFSSTKVKPTNVYPVLGDFKGDKTLKGKLKSFQVNDIPAHGVRLYYLGNKKQPHIHGDMKELPSKDYSEDYYSMYVRGSINMWGNKNPMKKMAPNQWRTEIKLNGPDIIEFKFEIGGGASWQMNWGDNEKDNKADAGGKNIRFKVKKSGNYIFKFNDKTREYSIKEK